MAVNTFGVTPATVQALYLPQIPGFSALSKPTEAAVTIMVSQSAGKLAGRLYGEGIDAEDISVTTSAAYLMCAEQLGKMVALKVHKVLPQKFPELAKEYTREVDAWFKELNEKGGTFLGDSGLNPSSSPSNGPTSHVSTYSLTQLDGEDMSDVIPPLKKSNRL